MDIKSIIKKATEKEKATHCVSNIMMTAVLGLILILTLCFGVKVNIGSAYFGDSKDVYVRQNIFQLADVALNSNMTQEDAVIYVNDMNQVMLDEYEVMGLEIQFSVADGASSEKLDHDFIQMVNQLGKDARRINLVKYKLAYAMAVRDTTSLDYKMSNDSHRIFTMSGQIILICLAQLAVMLISLVMLVFAVISLVKKRDNTKMRFAFILLSVCAFFNILLFSSLSFLSINWAGIFVIVLTFLGATCLSLIRHALMDRRDFSFTMLIHNAALLVGAVIAFALYMSPIFKMTTDTGLSTNIGWAYMFDYVSGVMTGMGAVMAYTLGHIITILMFMLPTVMFIAIMLTIMARFMVADYQLNEKRIILIITFILTLIEFILLASLSASGNFRSTYLYITVKLSIVPLLMSLLIIGGLIAFEILYKVKPVKKELVIR